MTDFRAWLPFLRELCDGIRVDTRAALEEALRVGDLSRVNRPEGRGAGDVTFGLDRPAEERIDRWLEERAREGPLSLLTEDRGWRHRGPTGSLHGFDHGGPRIAIDPIDGTRNLMADLRSAWTVVSFAPAGAHEPWLTEMNGGVVAEIPPSRVTGFQRFESDGERCTLLETDGSGAELGERLVRVDEDDRADHGYFPVFRYHPELRVDIAHLEAGLFERLARHEGSDVRSCYDDQYISNAGQLVLLSRGTYRFVSDPRALVARVRGIETVTSKPYDVAGAILCARGAGARLTAADGAALDFPLDATTPVSFVGYANGPTESRLAPHWLATVDEWSRSADG